MGHVLRQSNLAEGLPSKVEKEMAVEGLGQVEEEPFNNTYFPNPMDFVDSTTQKSLNQLSDVFPR